jgi:hypothetical protein
MIIFNKNYRSNLNMRKRFLSITILVAIMTGCSSKAELYTMTIDVTPKKELGMDWDIMGGSPDIKVIVDKHPLYQPMSCRDTYRCSLNFTSKEDEWYIEIYDSDIDSDDLIGKGDCEEGDECSLGFAKIKILD